MTRDEMLALARSDRFWSKVMVRSSEECWPWTASTNGKGYGQYSIGSRTSGTYRMVAAYRYAYEQTCCPIPEGMHLDHLCRNRLCCNPAHLEPVTPAENNKRAAAVRTECKRGHPLIASNLLKGKNDTRECRQCRLDRKKEYRHAHRAS